MYKRLRNTDDLILTEKKRNIRRKACAIAFLCTKDPTRIDLGFNPVPRHERPVTNIPIHGKAWIVGRTLCCVYCY
jgi:hypothetical protein